MVSKLYPQSKSGGLPIFINKVLLEKNPSSVHLGM